MKFYLVMFFVYLLLVFIAAIKPFSSVNANTIAAGMAITSTFTMFPDLLGQFFAQYRIVWSCKIEKR